MTAPALRPLCSRCCQPYDPPLNRPDWPRCITCTLGGSHAPLKRFGAAPAYPMPLATANRVTWVVPGPPLSVNRVHGLAFRNGKRVMYFTREGRLFKSSVAGHALAALSTARVRWDRTRRYTLTLMSYFATARSDSDNPLKVVKDALNGVLWTDDVQVISDHTEKDTDKVAPRLVVTVEAIP